MASEAQRLIGISLTKIAQSRTHRGGVSLHKNLLVATVLQKARYIFMEEAYNMVHYQQASPVALIQQPMHHHLSQLQQQQVQTQQLHHQEQSQQEEDDEDELVGLTVEEAGVDETSLPEDQPPSAIQDFFQPGCTKCTSNHQHDKENQPPNYHNEQLTYLDLDKTPNVLQERSGSNLSSISTTTTTTTTTPICLKRRRAVSEWETEEAVQSILPKRRCTTIDTTSTTDSDTNDDDSVFLDDATLLSETVSKELEESSAQTTTNNHTNSMDSIDRITSLVSIFSFGMTAENNSTNANGKLTAASNRSVSTPDLCSSQAKEGDTIQQRPFLAMTV